MEISLKMNSYKADILPILFIHKEGGKNKLMKGTSQLKIMSNMQKEKIANNLYEVLSLRSTDVGFEEIKKAYRCKALQHHPDICHHSNKEESTRQFIELRKAYETLSDPISRQSYDYELSLMNSSESELMWRKSKEKRKTIFTKEVWERQLDGLRRRSCNRMEKKKCTFS
ncbi:chaperone protein dnaJ 20, chloroplastic-like [Lycium barbarum]|uniref:chaperone protein dnaJ 20, chloroplastic-like n=1 Tax=Lycium barbarum TaxID=112863 RepID=UPI00293F1FE9|nr:chaperone protein dnaJ 20, chloroplastic-like [Lycium barbarum]